MSKKINYDDDSDYEGYQSESDDELEFDFDVNDEDEDEDEEKEVEIIYEEFYNEKELSNRIIPKKNVNDNKPSVQKAGKLRIKKRNNKK